MGTFTDICGVDSKNEKLEDAKKPHRMSGSQPEIKRWPAMSRLGEDTLT